MMGYAEDVSDLALPDVQQGHLLTGDLAVRDDDGYFTLHGRLKRFIKVFGNRIGLDEVEAQLREKGFDVAVTGRDELLVIAVRNSQPNQQDQEALITEASSSYRLHHSAIRVMAVESFPMSSAGKIQYAELLNALVP
jgi:acyl-coenzyme A synthetase/AMP-(fatty) acid ligase